MFELMEASARRQAAGGGRSAAAVRVGARGSIFTTADVRSPARRSRPNYWPITVMIGLEPEEHSRRAAAAPRLT